MTTLSQIESYLTVRNPHGPVEFKEKGSRFISNLFPVTDADHCSRIITEQRKTFYDCTHVCSAFIIGEGKEDIFRYNDDGEPSGSAGLPIYHEIKGASLFNVLVTVIRYYGGVKLGTGGLTRAYGQSAKMVINTASPQRIYRMQSFQVVFPYNFTGEIMQLCERYGLEVISQEYRQNDIVSKLDIPVAKIDSIDKILINKSAGKVKLQPL